LTQQAVGLLDFGRLEVVRRIARGGMAEIFLARTRGAAGFEKNVVVKRVLPTFSQSPEWVSMFLDEARLTAALSHPNIAHVYDLAHDGQSYYFVMEYLEGEDLRAVVKHCHATRQSLPLWAVLSIVSAAAAGLHAAHTARSPRGTELAIVHRDVSPSNIFVSFDGTVKVLDFGVAKAIGRMTETRAGIRKGKVSYMSPEQILGREIDSRSDVFALGIVLYELTVRRRLFIGDNEVAIARRVVDCNAPDPRDVVENYPDELAEIVLRALSRDSRRRFQSAQQLQLALEGFATRQQLCLSSARLANFMERTYRDKRTFLRLVGTQSAEAGAELDALPVKIDSSEVSEVGILLAAEQRSAPILQWVIPLFSALLAAALTAWLLAA
jgi:serine/threonine-protein kinase